MPDDKPLFSFTDGVTRLLTLVSLAIAVVAAWKALPADAEIKRLQAQAQELDLALKKADADLKELESSRKVTLELYQEVKNVIAKKDKDAREEEAVRVLVESLAEDPFRWKLLKVLAVGASSEEVKEAAAATSKFYEDEAAVRAKSTSLPTPTTAADTSAGFGAFNIDFFYCDRKRATSEPLARAALDLRATGGTGRWRVRALPESVNQQPGYGISESEIRFTPPDETAAANALAKALSGKGIHAALHETSYPTPGYVSVFVCQ